jgi:hypothetical protein
MRRWRLYDDHLDIEANTIIPTLVRHHLSGKIPPQCSYANPLVPQPDKYVFFSFLPPEERQKDKSVSEFANILHSE